MIYALKTLHSIFFFGQKHFSEVPSFYLISFHLNKILFYIVLHNMRRSTNNITNRQLLSLHLKCCCIFTVRRASYLLGRHSCYVCIGISLKFRNIIAETAFSTFIVIRNLLYCYKWPLDYELRTHTSILQEHNVYTAIRNKSDYNLLKLMVITTQNILEVKLRVLRAYFNFRWLWTIHSLSLLISFENIKMAISYRFSINRPQFKRFEI